LPPLEVLHGGIVVLLQFNASKFCSPTPSPNPSVKGTSRRRAAPYELQGLPHLMQVF
jgi:hypothetical protein